jgi:rod shape determining protein RodA
MSATPLTPADESAVPRVRMLPLFDPMLLLAGIGLMVCSLETLKGATSHAVPGHPLFYVQRQALFGGIGLLIALVLSRIDYSRLREFKYALLGIIVVALAGFAVDRARRIHEWRTTARIMLLAVLAALLVIPQPDLGTGMVYVAVGFSILFFAGTSFKQITALVTLFVVSIAVVLAGAPAVGVHVLKPYQIQRLTAFLHPSGCTQSTPGVPDPCYQLQQSQIAIGSGQKTGRGNNATQTKLNFLPANDTDFVFAAVGETYGFVGAVVVLSLYALLIWRALRILTMSKNLFGTLITAGILAMLMFQIFVNVGMTIGIMPITGVPLPLVSYGGSSVIVTFIAIGLLQSIYVQARMAASGKARTLIS